jgi:hypothetical protein
MGSGKIEIYFVLSLNDQEYSFFVREMVPSSSVSQHEAVSKYGIIFKLRAPVYLANRVTGIEQHPKTLAQCLNIVLTAAALWSSPVSSREDFDRKDIFLVPS